MRNKFLPLIFCFSLVAPSSAQPEWPCQEAELSSVKRFNPTEWVSNAQLQKHAIENVPGSVPSPGCIWRNTIIVVDVIVNEAGEVICAKAPNKGGHGLLKGSAVMTARKWKFKPFMKDGQPAMIQGKLEIHFAQNSGLSRKKIPTVRIE